MNALSSNLRGIKFRELVGLFLKSESVAVIPKPRTQTLAQSLAPESQLSDLQGLARWTINTRSDYQHDWSNALDAARRDAALDGKPLAAVVQFRRGRPIAEAYVAIELATFAELLRDEVTT